MRSSPALDVDYQLWGHWGRLLPIPKYPAGALQVTKTYLGSHKASTKGHSLPCFHLCPCRIHEAPTVAPGHVLPPLLLTPGDSEACKVGMNLRGYAREEM